MKKSGRILIVAELAREYGFKDVGGVLLYLVSNSSEFDRAFILIFGEMRTFQNTPCLVNKPRYTDVLPDHRSSVPYSIV